MLEPMIGTRTTIDDNLSEFDDLDEDLKALSKFLNIDRSKIQSVINAFNKHGPNVSYTQIGRLTGLDVISDAVDARDALATLVHFYVKHYKLFEDRISHSKVDKTIIEELNKWISKLDKNGLAGLDTLYSSLGAEGTPSLRSIDHNLLLSEILDDNRRQIGYLPVLRLELVLTKDDGDNFIQNIFMPVDSFNVLVETLQNIKRKLNKSSKKYRERLGDSVILAGDD